MIDRWAEHELHMMKHFFNNLAYYTNAVRQGIKLPHSLWVHTERPSLYLFDILFLV